MIIAIKTTEDKVHYEINHEDRQTTNDELCRAIAHLDVVKQELLKNIDYDYEVTENKEE